MSHLARTFVFIGIGFILIGGLIWAFSRIGLPLGRLPGDIRIQTGSLTCLIPLATSILLSIILTIALNVFIRLMNK